MAGVVFDVDCRMVVKQLVMLQASPRYGRTLRNMVELHHVYVLKLLTPSASYVTKRLP